MSGFHTVSHFCVTNHPCSARLCQQITIFVYFNAMPFRLTADAHAPADADATPAAAAASPRHSPPHAFARLCRSRRDGGQCGGAAGAAAGCALQAARRSCRRPPDLPTPRDFHAVFARQRRRFSPPTPPSPRARRQSAASVFDAYFFAPTFHSRFSINIISPLAGFRSPIYCLPLHSFRPVFLFADFIYFISFMDADFFMPPIFHLLDVSFEIFEILRFTVLFITHFRLI